MNKLLLFFLALAPFICGAQPTYTLSNLPQVGDQATTTLLNPSDFSSSPSGANVTWDFSNATLTGASSTSEFVVPSTTPYASNFPAAGFCAIGDGGATYAYYAQSFVGLELIGAVGGASSTVFSYSDPDLLILIPSTYNDATTDNFTCTFTSGGISFIRTGSSSIVADSYGTLLLPNGTQYNNVIRYHLTQNYQDGYTVSGIPQTINYVNDQYYFFSSDHRHVLASHFELTSDASAPFIQFSYVENAPLSSVQPEILSDINIIQTGEALWSWETELNIERVEVLGINGALIQSVPVGTNQIDLSSLAAGIFVLRFTTDEGEASKLIHR